MFQKSSCLLSRQLRLLDQSVALAIFAMLILGLPAFGQAGGPPPPPPIPFSALVFYPLAAPPWLNWYGEPADCTNVSVASSWDYGGTCLSIDTNVEPAFLRYGALADGDRDILFDNGSISLWFQANWSSGDGSLTDWAALLSVGNWTSNAAASAWTIAIAPSGTDLVMEAQSNGLNQIVFDLPINFQAGDWHQVTISYSLTNCCAYIDGQISTNTGPVSYYPTDSDCANYGMCVGSLPTSGQCHGQLQWLATYDYPLSSNEVASDYANVSSYISFWGGSLIGSGGIQPNIDPTQPPSGWDGGTNGGGGGGGGGSLGSPAFTPGTNLCLFISLQSNAYASILLSNTVAGLPYLLLAATNLDGPWFTNQSFLAASTTTLAAPIPIGNTNAVFFQAVQETPGTLKWMTYLGGDVDSLATGIDGSVAIGPDGTLYVSPTVSIALSTNNLLFAIDPLTGNVLRSNNIFTNNANTAISEISSSAAVAPDGTIYIGSADGRLYALNTNLSTRWAYDLRVSIFASPALGPDGTVYIGTDNAASTNVLAGFFALTNNVLKWSFTPTDLSWDFGVGDGAANTDVESSAALGADGTVYFIGEDDRLYALSTNGNVLWFVPVAGHAEPDSSPALGPDGTIYATGSQVTPFVYAIAPDGCLKWVFDESLVLTNQWMHQSSPVVGPDGTIYVGTSDSTISQGVVLAINSDGSLKWSLPLTNGENGDWAVSTPAIATDGTLYIGSLDRNLYAITNSGTNVGIEWSYTTSGGIVASPVIGRDGAVYVGSEDGYLYAFWGSSLLASNASWPMFRQNPAHTGAVSNSTPPPADCGAPFVFGGAVATDDYGQPASFSFSITATNWGATWNVFASTNLTNWVETNSILLTNDGFGDSNGFAVFTDTNIAGITNRFYVLADGDCLSNSCRSRVIGFMNLTYAPGTNLIADQLYDVQNLNWAAPAPMNTPNELFGDLLGYPIGILKWNGQEFDAITNAVVSFSISEWFDNNLLDYHTTLLPGTSVLFTNGSGSSFSFPFVGLIRTQQVFQVQSGTNYLAATLPVAGAVTNITGYAAHNGDIIQLWNTNTQVFHSFTNTGSTWSPSNPVVRVGEGFVLITTNASTWTNTWNQSFPCSGP